MKHFASTLLGLAAVLTGLPAAAQTSLAAGNEWQFEFIPYLWLAGIRSIARSNRDSLGVMPHEQAVDRLCELNVLEQAKHVARTTILEDAWERGQAIHIHSWIYRLDTGRISRLSDPITAPIEA